MPDNILRTVENDPKFRALPPESRKEVLDSLLNEDPKFKALDTKDKSTVQQKLYNDFASSPQQQQIDHAKHVAGQIVQKHISPNSGASGVIQYPHTSIGPPDAAPHQNMIQRGISTVTDPLSTPAAMVKSAVQPLAARMFPSKEPPLSPLTGDPTDRYEELRVAAMPYWERVQYMKSQPMKHLANPSKQYQDQVWLDKQPLLSHVMEHGGEVAAGMASDPTMYALGAGWLSKAPKLARATSAAFATMQAAPYVANPSMLKDPKALIDIPLAIVAAWHAAGLKMPAPVQEALTRGRAKGTGGIYVSKADAAKLSEQFAQKEHRYNSEFKSKAPDKPGVQRGLPKAELPKAKEKTNAVQKQGAEKSVSRRQRSKVELQGVGEGNAKETPGTRKGKAKEIDHAPTKRRKPGSVPGERETNAGGRVPARSSTSGSKAGADKSAAAPVQSNKVQSAKPQAPLTIEQVNSNPDRYYYHRSPSVQAGGLKARPFGVEKGPVVWMHKGSATGGPGEIYAIDPDRVPGNVRLSKNGFPVHEGDIPADAIVHIGTRQGGEITPPPAKKSLTSETSKPTHVNKTVFRQSIDKLKALGHDVEHLEGGYLLYNKAKTPADIKAASLALRDELQKTAAKTPVKAPSNPARAAKPTAGTNVPTKGKAGSTGHVASNVRVAQGQAFVTLPGGGEAKVDLPANAAERTKAIRDLQARYDTHVELSKEKIDENYGKDFPPESGQTFRGDGGAPQGGRQAAGSVRQGWEAAGEAGNAKNISGKQRPPIVVGKHTGTVYITDPMAWHQIATAAGTKDALASRGFFAQQMTVDSIASKLPNKMAQDFLRAAKGGASVVNISKFRGNANITDVVRHEPVHEAQHRIYANSPSETTRSGRTYKQIAHHMDDSAYTKAHQKLKSMGYVSPDVEVPAWIIAGQYKPLGLTDSEAAQVISQFYDDVNRNHGPTAAASLFKRAIGPARAVSRAARARRGMASFGGPGRPGSPQARVTSAVSPIISRVKTYAPTEKTGGRYHMTAVIDSQTADLEHTLSNTDSYGDQLGSWAFRRVTAGLDATEREDFVRFMQSNNLAVDNPSHPSVLTNRRMESIWGKPGVPLTASQAKIQAASILHSEVQRELFGLVKKGKPSVPKKVGLQYAGPSGEDLFMNMIAKQDAAGNPVMINPKPGAARRRVASQMKVNASKAALPRAGTAAEYETDLEKIYQQAYKNALPGAVKSDIYSGMVKKGLAQYYTGKPPSVINYKGVDYPVSTELVREGKKPGEVGTIKINIAMPAQIHADVKDATSAKPFAKHTYINPNAHGGPKTKSSSQARDAENALTDAQLASPKVITGHSLRVITMVTKMVDPSLPGIRKAVDTLFNAPTLGIAPRLTRLYDLANLDPTSTTEYISKEGHKYSNQSIRVDLARANAVDNRTFDNTSALGKAPGIRQMREMGHGALFSDPKGPSDLFKAKTVSDLAKSIQEFGLDIRAKVMIEKVRRMADGYDPKDPKLDDKIRNNAYKLGEYVKKPNKYVEFLKTLNTYAGTSAPMRKTELQQFFGNTGISGKALSPAQREVYRAQTLAMSGIGTFMGYVMWNKLLSGHMPWDNKSDNTLEFGNGWHLSMSAVNPADTRAMSTLGLLRSARGLETGNYSDIPKAIGKGVIGAAADLATGPGVRMMATAAGADLYLIDPNGNAMLAKAYPGAQYPLPSSLYDDDDSGKDTYAKRFRAVLGEINPVGETFMDLLGGSSNSLSALRSPRSTYDSSEVNPWDSLWRHVKSADTLFNSPLIQEDKEPKSSGALDPEAQKYMRQQEQYQKIGQPITHH